MDAAYSGPDARALPATVAKFAAGDLSALPTTPGRQRLPRGPVLHAPMQGGVPVRERGGDAPGRPARPGQPPDREDSFGRLFPGLQGLRRRQPPTRSRPSRFPARSPTLFLAAEIDPGCPPSVAKAAVSRFSKGQLTIIPNATHGVSRGSACARKMIRSFLADPTVLIDQSCLHPEHDKFVFDLGSSGGSGSPTCPHLTASRSVRLQGRRLKPRPPPLWRRSRRRAPGGGKSV